MDLKRAPKGTAAWRRIRRLIRKRARIEPVIGHLKSGYRLCRNYLHGWEGDELNVLFAAAGWNLRKLLRFLFAYPQTIILMIGSLLLAVTGPMSSRRQPLMLAR